MMMAILLPAGLAFCFSLFAVALNGVTAAWRNDLRSVQSMHMRSTSRFGGLAVFLACAISMASGLVVRHPDMVQIFFCALPVLLVGLCEDAGWRVHPYLRLMAGVVSSSIAIHVSGAVIARLGFMPLDLALNHQVIAIGMTILAVTGVSQSFNLLDGLHGICALTSVLIALSLALIATKGGQVTFAEALVPVATGLMGFLVLNFPRGLIFLGDAGATCIGFILAFAAVKLLNRVPDLSPFALVLVFFWPIADTLLAVARRLTCNRQAMRADRMHFHHVVMRALEILVLRTRKRAISNPAATSILMPLIAMPTFLGVVLWNRNELALTVTLIFAVLFVTAYRMLVLYVQRNWKVGLFVGGTVSNQGDLLEEPDK